MYIFLLYSNLNLGAIFCLLFQFFFENFLDEGTKNNSDTTIHLFLMKQQKHILHILLWN